jgi:hypothetical protein
MARNSSGTMTAPGSYPPVADTVISLDDYKALVADLINELTDSLSRSDKGGMLAALKLVDGTQALPALSFGGEASSGLYRAGAGDVRLSILGALRAKFTATGLTVTGDVTASGTTSGLVVSAPDVKADAFSPRSPAQPMKLKGDGAKLLSVVNSADSEKAYFDADGKLFLNGSAIDVMELITPRRAISSPITQQTSSTVKQPIPKDVGGTAGVNLTTRGRPVLVQLEPADPATAAYVNVIGSSGLWYMELEVVRDGTLVGKIHLNAGNGVPPGAISVWDDAPAAGAHVYEMNWVLSNGGMGGYLWNCKIVATEF